MALKNETDFLKLISSKPRQPDAVLGIGDDCAIYRSREGFYAVTTDMIVEGDHFSLDYFSPYEIGVKAMESNVSDIAAMGATPLFAFISICLKPNTSEKFIREFYRGIHETASRYKIDIMGGDTTHGAVMVVNVTLTGFAKNRKSLVLRSGAKEGDLIFVTGKLGASTAGLKLFQQKIAGHGFVKKKHTQPQCRLDLSSKIANIANSMEDISDGLASEIRNICIASRKGAVIYAERVPIAKETCAAARAVGNNALDYALFGGEDFELVFTVSPRNRKKAEKLGTFVGKITSEKEKIYLQRDNKAELLKKFGYDHFSL